MKTNSPSCFTENNHTYFYLPFWTLSNSSLSMEREDNTFRKLTIFKSSLSSCSLWLNGFLCFGIFFLGVHMKGYFSALFLGLLKFPKIEVCPRNILSNVQILIIHQLFTCNQAFFKYWMHIGKLTACGWCVPCFLMGVWHSQVGTESSWCWGQRGGRNAKLCLPLWLTG